MRNIRAPGIQINEIDRSQYDLNNEVFQNTTTLVMGFADKGDDYDPRYVFSMNDFIKTYGNPKSEAERYFYLAAEEIFRNGGLMIGGKLPYDNDARNNYTYVKYNITSAAEELVSPYKAITSIEDGDDPKSLSAFFTFGENDFVSEISSNISVDCEITQAFYNFLAENCNFDYSLTATTENLFNQPLAFHNLSALFENQKTVIDDASSKIVPRRKRAKTDVSSEYITRYDLWSILEGHIPEEGTISSVNTLISSYMNFTNSFNSLIPRTRSVLPEEDGLMESFGPQLRDPAVSGDVVYDNKNTDGSSFKVEESQLSAIALKLVYAGFEKYEDARDAFFNSMSMSDVKAYYNDLSSLTGDEDPFNCLTAVLPSKEFVDSFLSADFTGIPLAFENVKTSRKILAPRRNDGTSDAQNPGPSSGKMSIEELDAFKVGYSKVPANSFYIVDITRGQYERDDIIEEEIDANGVVTKSNEYLGILPVVTTAANAMYIQNLLAKNENYDSYNPLSSSLNNVVYEKTQKKLPDDIESRFFIPLRSDDPNIETVGQIATSYFPSLTYLDENRINPQYLKNIGIVVFKITPETSTNKVTFTAVESFAGSFDRTETDPITKASTFIDDVVNNNSEYINVFSNVEIDKDCDIYTVSNQIPTSLGFYESQMTKDISYQVSIIDGMDAILTKLEDTNRIPIDIVLDAGVSNIAQFVATTQPNGKGDYKPEESINGFKKVNPQSTNVWKTILRKLDNFCSNTRRDCMFIADGPRQLVLDGNYPVVRKTNLFKSVRNEILPYIKYLTGIDTSYGAGYVNWFKVFDSSRNMFMWCPPSIKAGGVYLYCDIIGNPWDAPAGITRGKVNAYDVSFNPTNDEAGTIYEANWNYAISYPMNGIIMEGQRTFQRHKTAFDRVNVRRLFLSTERGVWMIARQYLYEGLTTALLNSFRDSVSEFLSKIKLNGGINDFYVLCDSRNNTPETFDNNELHCSIGLKPTRSAEFIILNFICTTQSANIEEVVNQIG